VRKQLTSQEKQKKSILIQQKVTFLLKENVSVFLYRSCINEVQTYALFEKLIQPTFVPVTQKNASMLWVKVTRDTRWKQGLYAIEEPKSGQVWTPAESPVVVICPLLAFDRQGHRLGQGMGCYDRWLATYGQYVQQIIALAFSCQEVSHISHEKHDYPIDMIITEDEVIQVPL